MEEVQIEAIPNRQATFAELSLTGVPQNPDPRSLDAGARPVNPTSEPATPREEIRKPSAPLPAPGTPALISRPLWKEESAPEPANGPKPTPMVEQIGRAMDTQVRLAVKDGTAEFHLQLNPPELGSIHVHLSASADGIVARLIVANDGTRQLIEGHLNELRQRLQAAFVGFTGGNPGQGRNQQRDRTRPTVELEDQDQRVRVSTLLSRVDGIDLIA
jgi:hypothetical protein